jgi:hypothetical protein
MLAPRPRKKLLRKLVELRRQLRFRKPHTSIE